MSFVDPVYGRGQLRRVRPVNFEVDTQFFARSPEGIEQLNTPSDAGEQQAY